MSDNDSSFDQTISLATPSKDAAGAQSRSDSMVEAAARMLMGDAGLESSPEHSGISASLSHDDGFPLRTRPRRPATQKRADEEARKNSQQVYQEERARHAHRRRGRRREGRNTKRSQSLEESLNSLRNFAKTNKGRRLAETTTKGLVSSVGHHQPDSPADGVHYVNIIEDEAAKSLSASFRRREIVEDVETGTSRVEDSNAFVIPMEPRGTKLTVNILSTWGDPHYVGLMGLEIYDGSGHLVELINPDKQLWADPADVNVLDGYDNDPRTVHNLVDGKNFTCDDLHAWLAPFEPGDDHFIHINFDMQTTVSMIRLWNYNKSRIHAFRGARYVEVTLDDQFIYRGEIKRATGSTKEGPRACSETLVFTRNKAVLKLIEKYEKSKYPGFFEGMDKKRGSRKLRRHASSEGHHGRHRSCAGFSAVERGDSGPKKADLSWLGGE